MAAHGAKRARQSPPSPPRLPPRFRLGAVPGTNPGTWIRTWRERFPRTELELIPLAVATQREAIESAQVDAALVRLPLPREGMHVIPLYEEVPVIAFERDSVLAAGDDLGVEDLADEVRIVAADDVFPDTPLPGTRPFRGDPPADTEAAIELVAAGAGILLAPMSLVRRYHRRDVAWRPLRGGPVSPIGLAWSVDRGGPAVDAFIGVVRGRTANSSR